MGKKSMPEGTDDTMEFAEPTAIEDASGSETKPKRHRKTKAALAAGAVASTVAATAAYRRHNSRTP